MTFDVTMIFIAVCLLIAAIGFRFGYWVAIQRYEPEMEAILEKNGELRSDLRQERKRYEITKDTLSSKVQKLKSKLKKKKRD